MTLPSNDPRGPFGVPTAVFSHDRRYRYALTRRWAERGTLAWMMLNPSNADEDRDDPTVRAITRFTRAWGYGGLVVVNLAGYVSSDPKALQAVDDPFGPANDAAITELTEGLDVMAAWGRPPTYELQMRAATWASWLRHNRRVFVLGVTKGGYPRHPLRLAADTPRIRWEHRA